MPDAINFQIERTLTLKIEGREKQVPIRLGPITYDREAWGCQCVLPMILGASNPIFGHDPLQALELALHLLRTRIQRINQAGQYQIYWLKPGDDGGFGACAQKDDAIPPQQL